MSMQVSYDETVQRRNSESTYRRVPEKRKPVESKNILALWKNVHTAEVRVCSETNMKYFANPVRKGMMIGGVRLGDRPPWLKVRRSYLSQQVRD